MNSNDYLENDLNDSTDLINKETNYTRYPLAKNPDTPLQNKNYKDWLNAYDPVGITFVSPQPYSSVWFNVVSSALGITAILLALSNPVTTSAAIAAGAGITAALLPILWPQDSSGSSSGNVLFNDMMNITAEMLNQSLSGLVQSQANALLTGLRNELEAYQRALVFWQNNQQSQPAINEVVNRYHTTNSQFRTVISQFTLQGYEVQLLQIYTAAANLHLLHIRDGVKYAQYWSLANRDTDTTASVFNGDFQHQELLYYMEVYTEYCTKWYWIALANMESAVNQNIGWDWVRFNDFRNLMITTVLDIVALFPTYDIRIYNKRLKMEILSRKIYSPPINFLYRNENVQQINKKYTLLPRLYSKLNDIECHTSGIMHQYLTYFLSGHRNKFENTNGDNIQGIMNGEISNINITQIVPVGTYNKGIGKVESFSLRRTVNNPQNSIPSSIIQMVFKARGGGHIMYTSNNPGIINGLEPLHSTTSIPEQITTNNQYPDFNHYLADMILADRDETPGVTPIDQIKSYSFAWQHGSIYPKNIVEPVKNNEIQTTIFPIVKANYLSGPSVIEGYSHSGGDVLLSKVANPVSSNVHHSLTFPFNIDDPQLRTRTYNIRLRYASNYQVTLVTEITFPGGGSTGVTSNVNPTFTHNQPGNLRIKDFSYVTLSGIFNLHTVQNYISRLTLMINHPPGSLSTGDRLFIIDKIEFTPIN